MSSERPDVVHEFHCEGKKNYYLKGDEKFDQPRLLSKREKLRTSRGCEMRPCSSGRRWGSC